MAVSQALPGSGETFRPKNTAKTAAQQSHQVPSKLGPGLARKVTTALGHSQNDG